jgi:hypothetical protein
LGELREDENACDALVGVDERVARIETDGPGEDGATEGELDMLELDVVRARMAGLEELMGVCAPVRRAGIASAW